MCEYSYVYMYMCMYVEMYDDLPLIITVNRLTIRLLIESVLCSYLRF